MAARPRTSEKGKIRVNFMIDKELHERMQRINEGLIFKVSWSEMVNQSLGPVVSLFEGAFEEFKKGDKADLDKIRLIMQGNVVELMGKAHKGLKGAERDVEKLKTKRKG